MLEYILSHAMELITIGTSVVTAASLIANMTPNTTDDKIVGYLSKGINLLALNWKKKA
jgi:hypothetical protein